MYQPVAMSIAWLRECQKRAKCLNKINYDYGRDLMNLAYLEPKICFNIDT